MGGFLLDRQRGDESELKDHFAEDFVCIDKKILNFIELWFKTLSYIFVVGTVTIAAEATKNAILSRVVLITYTIIFLLICVVIPWDVYVKFCIILRDKGLVTSNKIYYSLAILIFSVMLAFAYFVTNYVYPNYYKFIHDVVLLFQQKPFAG
jgi:hypothetical protein